MTLDSVMEMGHALFLLTAVNVVVAFGITFTYLIIRDKLAKRRRDLMRGRKK
tara:strand:- start:1681 stop:1836 length:156 start_codon:yes stop_codon:yes gene_type:complete